MFAIRFVGVALFLTVASLASADVFDMPAGQTSLQFVTVGNAGNAANTTGWGSVGYGYRIGMFDVTASQYAEFLNAVAKDDLVGLYCDSMASTADCGIVRSGDVGDFSYAVTAGCENRPVNYMSFGNAARFCNWLTNGQPTGDQDLTTTEDGSYFLNWATVNADLLTVTRKPGARFVLPSIDEWYKAAYYDPNKPGGAGYWAYPTMSDSPPVAEAPPGGTEPPGSANFKSILGSIHLTDVGAYFDSPGPYGTFDQGGLLYQWSDTLLTTSYSGFGAPISSWSSSKDTQLRADNTIWPWSPINQYSFMGFRVAEVPEPGTLGLIAGAMLAMIAVGAGRKMRRPRRRHSA